MQWVERVNGNGRAFQQWQATAVGETMPDWGPDTAYDWCLICGERYEAQYMDVGGVWHPSKRLYIYHDPQRHRDYAQRIVPEIQRPREPGES